MITFAGSCRLLLRWVIHKNISIDVIVFQLDLKNDKDFKDDFKAMEPWKKGMPKRVNNLTTYGEKLNKQRKVSQTHTRLRKLHDLKPKENTMIPGHVRASINWNNLKQANSDNYSITITDGAKVIVCRMKNTQPGPDFFYQC